MEGTPLRHAVTRVVDGDNCSGCGACTALSATIAMETDAAGFRRPAIAGIAGNAAQAKQFRTVCPGVRVTAPPRSGRQVHPTMGPFVSAWTAWAGDPELRFAGSSGGVLSALSAWLLDTGQASAVVGATMDRSSPSRTVPIELKTRAEVLAAAGSRYAPVSNAEVPLTDPRIAFVGKPCEVDAVLRLVDQRLAGSAPLLLSFFCAGVPSQRATDELIDMAGMTAGTVAAVRYRGNGWPGAFVVTDSSGTSAARSYEESWGRHLGPQVQARCKICPDGTGGHADIAVGDYWQSDAAGFPLFADADGTSVAIARTERGHQALTAARKAGVVVLEPVDLDSVAAVQPLQVKRIRTLPGRLAGMALARRPVPRMHGYSLLANLFRHARSNFSAARGAFYRARWRPGSTG